LVSGISLGTNQAKAASVPDVGLSTYYTNQFQTGFYANQIIQAMEQNNLTILRLSFNPSWYSDANYNSSFVQYFLDHSNLKIIVDCNHLYPRGSSSDADAVDHWSDVQDSLLSVCQSFPNDSRIYIELINEYDASDFYSRMQGLINTIRNDGYTNPLVADKTDNIAWSSLNDPLNDTFQGMHYYFDGWSLQDALNDMQKALTLGCKIINTEIGANGNGYSYFNQSEVNDVNSFLNTTYYEGITNCVWQDGQLNDFPTYEQLGLTIPSGDCAASSSTDITMTEIIPYKTCVDQGTSLPIDVTIENQGILSASTNLTLEASYTYIPMLRSFTLIASATQGWNFSIPGPTITAYLGDTINLQLQSSETNPHDFYVDYNGVAFPDSSDPQSGTFTNCSTQLEFTLNTVGNFTYYDAYNQNTMFGQLSVMQPPQPQLFSSQNVSLDSEQEMNVTFTFDTSQLPIGNYSFRAYVGGYGETNTTDNSLQSGNVTLTIPGDVNGDFVVDMRDMAIVARCLGSTPGSSNWDPNADITDQGAVTMKDLAIVAKNLGARAGAGG